MNTPILACSLFLLCVFSGALYSKKYVNRTSFYKSLLQFNDDFIASISFRREELNFLLKAKYESEYFNQIINSYSKKLNDVLAKISFPNFLTNKEKSDIYRYFEKLGKQDGETALKILNNYGEYFKKIYNVCVEEMDKNGALSKKIGVILGLIAFIIVV